MARPLQLHLESAGLDELQGSRSALRREFPPGRLVEILPARGDFPVSPLAPGVGALTISPRPSPELVDHDDATLAAERQLPEDARMLR